MNKIINSSVFINFKAYAEVDGEKALDLAKICESVSEETGVLIAICPPVVELSTVARNVNIPVLSQNVDPRTPGSSTGWITSSMIKSAGAIGTLINHSEHKFDIDMIEECVKLSKSNDLLTVICADTTDVARKVAKFNPDFIAVEPPELIGGDISVTTANPAIVEDTVNSVKGINDKIFVLCGAGVKNGDDVKAALELGADGVLLASGVVKAKDPRSVLLDLVKHL